MDFNFFSYLNNAMRNINLTLAVINLLLHLIFASAVAKDSGRLAKLGRTTYLVSGITWAFATLVGGILVAALYWLMHYSSLARGSK
ncbi:MAG: hypothetical protein AAGG80_04265 [Pseudomonadota bacterium]